MALTKQQKNDVIEEVKNLLLTSRLTVVAKYKGVTVKAMQQLRHSAKESETTVKVVKNRLFKKALEQSDRLKDIDKDYLEGMLLYAFNNADEVAPAKCINLFASTNPNIEFVGGISADGRLLTAAEVKTLALLPSKDQLIAEVIATLLSPIHNITNALSGNLVELIDSIVSNQT